MACLAVQLYQCGPQIIDYTSEREAMATSCSPIPCRVPIIFPTGDDGVDVVQTVFPRIGH